MSTAKTHSPAINTGSGGETAEDQVPDLTCNKTVASLRSGSWEQGLRHSDLSQKAPALGIRIKSGPVDESNICGFPRCSNTAWQRIKPEQLLKGGGQLS